MASAFYVIQMVCYYTWLQIKISSNTELYLDQFRKLIKMELASPNNVIKHFNPQFSIQEMLGLEFNRLSAAQESTGLKSVSYVGNISTYLFMAGALVAGIFAFLLAVVIVSGCKSRLKKWMLQKKAGIIKKKSSYNGQINTIHLTFLESSIAFQTYSQSLNLSGFTRNWKKLLPRLSPFLVTFAFPFIEVIAVFVYRKKLNEPFWKDKIGAIWAGSHFQRHWANGLVKPFALMRRVFFILLPYTFNGYLFFQVQFLIVINLAHAMYYAAWRPEKISPGKF